MSLKNIFSDYKNKKNPENIGIKSILQEYKNHVKAKNAEYENEIKQAVVAETFMNKIIFPAFEKLRIEFTEDGDERKADVNIRDIQASVTVFCNNIQEFIYRVSIKKSENDFQVSSFTYHINSDGEISDGKEERLFAGKKVFEIGEEEIRMDFYTKYRTYLLSRV